jgi:hypothetical protein
MIPDAWSYIPKNKPASNMFGVINPNWSLAFPDRDEVLRLDMRIIQAMVGEFVSVPICYLANQSENPQLQNIGETAFWAMNRHDVVPMYSTDLRGTMQYLTIPSVDIVQYMLDNGLSLDELRALSRGQTSYTDMAKQHFFLTEPHFFVLGNKRETKGVLHVDPQFLVSAQQHPVEVGAAMTFTASQIRDFKTERWKTDSKDMMHDRGRIYEAQFLLESTTAEPEYPLQDYYREALAQYPQGVNTPGIPEGLLY